MAEAIPDGATPIVGWRMWNPFAVSLPDHGSASETNPHVSTFRLFSMGSTSPWPMYQANVARCSRRHSTHHAPAEGCTCGIHAVSSLARLVTLLNPRVRPVIGEVYLWGKVVLTERGYRAEYAYPKRLIVTPYLSPEREAMPSELTTAYGVPVSRMWRKEVLQEAGLW